MSWLRRLFGRPDQAERPTGVPHVPESGNVDPAAARPPVGDGEVLVWIEGGWAVMSAHERAHLLNLQGAIYHHASDKDGAWVYERLR